MLSVIIPVFNTQEYIGRCLESILNQSFKDLELIIINDASVDNSDAIIQSYCKKYNNIKYIKLSENSGVGNARNLGLEQSKGEYISFVDSDDWIDSNLYKVMIEIAIKHDSDITICGVKDEFDNMRSSNIRYQYNYENHINSSFALDLLSRTYNQDIFITPMVCNKIFKSALLKKNKMKFEKNSYFEDDLFSFFTIIYSEKIVLAPNVYYHYYQRNNSISHHFSKKHIDDLITTFIIIKNELSKKSIFNEYKSKYYSYFEKCITSTINMLVISEQKISVQKEYLKYFTEKYINNFSILEYVDFLDIQRIRKFFNL